MKNPKFQVFVGRKKQFYSRLLARNGEIILGSEGYTSKEGCLNGIRSVKKNASLDKRYVRKTARNEQAYFVLVAGNAQVIGVSERYTRERRRESGIRAVKRVADGAPIDLPGNGASSSYSGGHWDRFWDRFSSRRAILGLITLARPGGGIA